MKKFISLFLVVCFISNVAFGDCDWSTIRKLPDGGYEYSPALNLCVGQLVSLSAVKDKQISDLTTAIDLKDAALIAADRRTLLWTNAAQDMQDKLAKIDADSKQTGFMYFGAGVLATVLAGFMTAKLIHP